MHGTLNHILAGDRIWLRRLTGEGDAPDRLDAILFDDLTGLRAAREREDARIVAFVDSLTEERLAGTFSYTNMSGGRFDQPLTQVLAHFFNHQTHHRGQAHGILSGLGREAPELDLIYYIRLEAGG